MKHWWHILLFFGLNSNLEAQTLPAGFSQKISGEDLSYFSPFREFANLALLTRCNGVSPIEWEAAAPTVQEGKVNFQFLIGFSNGTSGGDRLFDVYLDDRLIFTFETKKNWVEVNSFQHESIFAPQSNLSFLLLEKDINKDMFGYLNIQLPENQVGKRRFKIVGRDLQSRDWLMVFEYKAQTKVKVQASALVLRAEQKRPVNMQCLIQEGLDSIALNSKFVNYSALLKAGYHTFTVHRSFDSSNLFQI